MHDETQENHQERIALKYCEAGNRWRRLEGRRDSRSRRRRRHWHRQFNRWAAKVDPLSNSIY